MAAPSSPLESSTESRLLDAAAAVFAERGYDGAGVAEIARRAGLTTGAIYSRYSGKAELLVEALDREMAGHLESVIAGAGTGVDATAIISALGAHVLDRDQHDVVSAGLLLEAAVAARREPELAAMLERRLADERMRLAKVIEQAKAEGLFDPAFDVEAVVTFIQSVGLGFAFFRTLETPMPDADAWQFFVDRLITAVVPSDASPTPPGATS